MCLCVVIKGVRGFEGRPGKQGAKGPRVILVIAVKTLTVYLLRFISHRGLAGGGSS